MRDRRDESRDPTREPVELRWSDAGGIERRCLGLLRELSRSGARIQSERAVQLQNTVRILVRGSEHLARVRSCVRAERSYMLGLEFDPEFQGILMKVFDPQSES
jgi:hypothetical protein